MPSLTRRASRFARKSAASGADAAVTISARSAKLMRPYQAPEAARMVEEKIVAVCEGAALASFAWGRFLLASVLRGGATPAQFGHALFDVAEAAAEPARRTVRANAHRLSRS